MGSFQAVCAAWLQSCWVLLDLTAAGYDGLQRGCLLMLSVQLPVYWTAGTARGNPDLLMAADCHHQLLMLADQRRAQTQVSCLAQAHERLLQERWSDK